MLPHGWIGPRPDDHRLIRTAGTLVPNAWCAEVVDAALPCGIRIIAQRRGFVVYDFAGWSRGVANPGRRGRTLGEASAAATPALVQRLRVMNAHQILLHSALMVTSDESPPVTRIGNRDLYRWDRNEDGSEYWESWTGILRDTVTPVDRVRTDTVPVNAFELSLAWLNDVVNAEGLIEFDLLSQAHAAVATHDRASAVVAGWTVCELGLNHLYRQQPLPGGTPTAEVMMDRLEQIGALGPETTKRLAVVRNRRNKWLHAGREPLAEVALEALDLATLMLSRIVPDLKTRAVGQLVTL